MGSASARGRDETGSNATEVTSLPGSKRKSMGIYRGLAGALLTVTLLPPSTDRVTRRVSLTNYLAYLPSVVSYFSKPLILMTILVMNTHSMYKRLL